MWWSISGIALQLFAGILLGLPYLFPGKLEKLDENWHKVKEEYGFLE